MRVQLSHRTVVLGVLLAATLAVSAWTLVSGSPDAVVVEPTARPATSPGAPARMPASASPGAARARGDAARTAPAGGGELALAARPGAPAVVTNLFGSYSYQAPGPVAPAPVAAAVHAPPLPFTYTGHLEIDGKDTYLFLQGDAPISATEGTVIGEFTLVEARGSNLVFLHGPSGERVPLSIAAVGR